MNELRRLFELACDTPGAQREAVLRANGADDVLVAEVLGLLDADAATQSRAPRAIGAVAAQLATTELHAGDSLGAWRLVREIGHGGMGAVYLAERADGHFSQQAAIKLIRGAGDAGAAARFARERQLLATLVHPQIARLLDGGATPAGEPYFVMEYVDGIALDRWCDMTSPGLSARLAMIVSICRALQVAHQRLVVHCDLKPSNILVRADGVPVLLDFGVAQVLDRSETRSDSGHDTATAGTQAFLTPRYASPEQRRGESATIACDIWSLGVLLHELASATPAPAPGMPLQPSRAAPTTLPWRRRLRGDIDAIVARACASDPAARYASALALAEDIERIGARQPVLARRPTLRYVASRLLQRRWPVFAIAALLVATAAAFTWRTVIAEREARAQAATAQRAVDFLVSAFALSDPASSGRHDFSAREVLDRGAARVTTELHDQPRVRARMLAALGNAYRGINEGNAGAPLLAEAARLDLGADVADPRAAAEALRAQAESLLAARLSSADAVQAATQAADLIRRDAADDPLRIAAMQATLARALDADGQTPAALATAEAALQTRRAHAAPAIDVAASLIGLCAVRLNAHEYKAALAACEDALAQFRSAHATTDPAYRAALSQYAEVLYYNGDYARGLDVERERLALTRVQFGEDSAALALEQVQFAESLAERGRYDEAAALIAQASPVLLRTSGERSVQYALAVFAAGWLDFQRGHFAASVPALRQALAIDEAAVDGRDNERLPVLRVDLASALIESGQANDEARRLLDAVIAARSAAHARTPELVYARLPLSRWLVLNRRFDEAQAQLADVDAAGSQVELEIHALAANTRAAIARLQGNLTRALQFDELAYDLTVRDVGADAPRIARYASTWAHDLREAGQVVRAAQVVGTIPNASDNSTFFIR